MIWKGREGCQCGQDRSLKWILGMGAALQDRLTNEEVSQELEKLRVTGNSEDMTGEGKELRQVPK